MANRTVVTGGIWAEGAPNLPSTPAEGVTYANSTLDVPTIQAGWPFATVVHSQNFNEIMRRVTTLLTQLETYGVLPWCATTSYPAGAIAMGADGVAYQSLVSTNLNKDPVLFPTLWRSLRTDPVPTGTVVFMAYASIPSGYLEANGQAVSRATYNALFTAIGTLYGIGDGASTFNLPDLRGEFVRGWDHGRGIDTGRVFGSEQLDAFKSHNHQNGVYKNLIRDPYVGSLTGSDTTGSGSEVPVGAGDAGPEASVGGIETRPRNIALLPLIKF